MSLAHNNTNNNKTDEHRVRNDDEVIVQRHQVSLVCPLSLRRIEIPVRGRHCKSHQCIDKRALEIFARGHNIVSCPVCLKRIDLAKDLIVIESIAHLITSTDPQETMVWCEEYQLVDYTSEAGNSIVVDVDDHPSPLPPTWVENRWHDERKRQRTQEDTDAKLLRAELLDVLSLRVQNFISFSIKDDLQINVNSTLERAVLHEVCEIHDVSYEDVDNTVILKCRVNDT